MLPAYQIAALVAAALHLVAVVFHLIAAVAVLLAAAADFQAALDVPHLLPRQTYYYPLNYARHLFFWFVLQHAQLLVFQLAHLAHQATIAIYDRILPTPHRIAL